MTSTSMPRQLRLVAAGLVLSIAGAAGLVAMNGAHAAGPADAAAAPSGAPGGMRMGHDGHERGGAPGMMGMAFEGRMLERVIQDVQATPEQAAQLRQISQSAASDLKAQRDAGQADQKAMMDLFTQPVVDARAAEALRQKTLARHDAMSQRMTQAMLEASRVLTVEQRKQLAERMAAMGGRHGMRGGAASLQGQSGQNNAPLG